MRKRSISLGPALIGSIALHVAVIILFVVEFPRETKDLVLSAVPVEIVSDKVQEAAPQPPQPETPPTPEPPQPTPTPAPPTPQPPAPKAETKPVEKPTPTPKLAPTPKPTPTKTKPAPAQKDFLSSITDSLGGSTPTKAAPHPPAPSIHKPGEGRDAVSTGPDVDALGRKVIAEWHPECGAPGADQVEVVITLRLRPDGSVATPPKVESFTPNNYVGESASHVALFAAKAARYRELPPEQLRSLSERDQIRFKLSQKKVCS